ncbi:hypothetical protein TD95_002073 [Thielaviopsis punctulata]|uniref:Uncharacterized protein n=1 Tax=Thielaviopsis punctulata TaxID=72032 RepID=A0A0F4ZK63_9PEZI|nr:hypothetical protein TD95_002073 [Thielaviopsis punctulata]
MAAKRPLDSEDVISPEASRQQSSKRARKGAGSSGKARQHQNAFIDSTFGQKYFFAGQGTNTSVPNDEELDFEDDSEAMAYLSSVRHQANGIPHLLVAPKVKMGPELPAGFAPAASAGEEDDEYGNHDDYEEYYAAQDCDGFYDDGAYTAAPDLQPVDDLAEIDPRKVLAEAYYSSILDRFYALRARLHRRPPQALIDALPKTHGTFVGSFGPRSSTFVIWNKRLLDSDPRPVQLAAMDKEGTLRVLRVLLGGKFLRMGHEVRERTSRWLWGLLARLPDAGEMQHTEIAWIRDLGRRAVLMARSLAEMAALREELANAGGDLGVHDAVDESNTDSNCLEEMDVDDCDDMPIHGDKVCGEALPNAQDNSSGGQDTAETNSSSVQNVGEDGSNNGQNTAEKPKSTEDIAVSTEDSTAKAAQKGISGGVQEASEVSTKVATNETTETAADGAAEQDQAMEISENEGEVPTEPPQEETLEKVKARLLAQLSHTEQDYIKEPEIPNSPQPNSDADEDEDEDDAAAEERERHARANMRHTLNMILTVAGEVYGQRDLLEFREPFPGL